MSVYISLKFFDDAMNVLLIASSDHVFFGSNPLMQQVEQVLLYATLSLGLFGHIL